MRCPDLRRGSHRGGRVPKRCRFGGLTKTNGNCTEPDNDGLAVQCVGAWTREKHDILQRYIAATRAVRAKFLPPGRGGAAFIDLFAGPGRARVRQTREVVDGSPLIALQHAEHGFSRVVLCEADAENAAALRGRTANWAGRVVIEPGDCNEVIDKLASQVPTYGLNLALIDPFSLKALHFATVAKLAAFQRMDLIVFFPVWQIRRFLDVHRKMYGPWLTRALGTDEWQRVLRRFSDAPQLIPLFHRQLQTQFSYTPENTYSAPIRGDNRTALYHLVFASKNPRGDRIWESVTRRGGGGQGRLF
jgi:three-Cys-motif partner protein